MLTMVNGGKVGRGEGDRRGAVKQRVWDDVRKQRTKGYVDSIREASLSFFFTNFPDEAKRLELKQAFALAGDVVDLFIPAKLDKLGRRFGFVRFQNERDVLRLERRLQNVWLGTYKLQVNRSHAPNSTSAANRKTGDMEKKKNIVADETVLVAPVNKVVVDQPSRWGEWPKLGAWKRNPHGGVKKSFNMDYRVDKKRVEMLSKCYVGILAESRSATALEFQHSLFMEGYHAIKVTPMGGNSVLLSSNVEGAIPDAITSNRSWWSAWLRGFSVWDPNLISSKRRVWLRCLGVPLHVWEESSLTVWV